jgi:huntingtin interacting protein 1
MKVRNWFSKKNRKQFFIIKKSLGLSGDALQSHRQRLTDQFRRLKRFYSQTSTLQYFKNLIKVPILPEV